MLSLTEIQLCNPARIAPLYMKMKLFPFSEYPMGRAYPTHTVGNWSNPRLCCKAVHVNIVVLSVCSSLLQFHGRFGTAQCEDNDIKINAARMDGGEWS